MGDRVLGHWPHRSSLMRHLSDSFRFLKSLIFFLVYAFVFSFPFPNGTLRNSLKWVSQKQHRRVACCFARLATKIYCRGRKVRKVVWKRVDSLSNEKRSSKSTLKSWGRRPTLCQTRPR